MTDISKLKSAASLEVYGLRKIMGSEKFSVSTDDSDSFIIDMESFSNGADKEVTANSRITMQRTKGSQRMSEKKIASIIVPEKDISPSGTSPRGSPFFKIGSSMPEKPSTVEVGTTDNLGSAQVHHHITITAGNISTNTDGRSVARKNSFRRSPPSWGLDPKRVLFIFATMSSLGTMLLIYFTLSVKYYNGNGSGLDWQVQR